MLVCVLGMANAVDRGVVLATRCQQGSCPFIQRVSTNIADTSLVKSDLVIIIENIAKLLLHISPILFEFEWYCRGYE